MLRSVHPHRYFEAIATGYGMALGPYRFFVVSRKFTKGIGLEVDFLRLFGYHKNIRTVLPQRNERSERKFCHEKINR